MQKRTLRNIALFLLKLIVFVVAWWYVYYKLTTMDIQIELLWNNSRFSTGVIVILLALMLCNWLFEIIKWRLLVLQICSISFVTACKGVLVGLPLALITPNRIGEIGGRAIVVKEHRKKIMFATSIGSLAQLSTTLLFGVAGFLGYFFFLEQFHVISILSYISLLALFCGIIIIVVFYDRRFVRNVMLKLIGKGNYRKIRAVVRMFSRTSVLQSFLYSIVRYMLFCIQFCILLYVFIPHLSILHLFVGVTLTYFFTTIIPTSVLGEVGIRGSVAMFIFGYYTSHEFLVFQVSLLMWIINIVLPTITGTFLLVGIKKGNDM